MRPFADSRRVLPILIAGIVGVLVLAGLFEPNVLTDGLLQVAQIVTAAGVLLGIGNLIAIHLRRLRASAAGSRYSLVLIGALIVGFALQLGGDLLGGSLAVAASALFRYGFQPLAQSLLALLTFFALRAAWRAVQVRPLEAWVVILVAGLFLLAGGPWAAWLPPLAPVLDWIRAYPVTGVARGLLLGVGIGAIVASVRLLLGFDQPYFDR